MFSSNTHFILGAKDPEMDIIEGILIALNYSFEHATLNSVRVSPTDAYLADNKINDMKDNVFIECKIRSLSRDYGYSIDHHHPADYGYTKDSSEFLEASSIGQFLKFILRADFEHVVDVLNISTLKFSNAFTDNYFYNGKHWMLSVCEVSAIIPERIVSIAAIDHCLHDAYLGLCFGVCKDSLLDMRLTALAYSTGLAYDDVKEIFLNFIALIKKEDDDILDFTYLNLGVGYSSDYLIIREASVYLNIPIAVKTLNSSSCSGKIMLFSLNQKQVKHILETKSFNCYSLKEVFGVPSRGYAGGMIAF